MKHRARMGCVRIQFCHKHVWAVCRPAENACLHAIFSPQLSCLDDAACRRRTGTRTSSCSRKIPSDLERRISSRLAGVSSAADMTFLKHLSAALMRCGTANKATHFLVTAFLLHIRHGLWMHSLLLRTCIRYVRAFQPTTT